MDCSKQAKILVHFCQSYPMAPFTLIHGCMFAGKTKALFRHVQQSGLSSDQILLVKHASDTRYQQDYIVSHEGERRECNPINLPLEISYLLNDEIKLVAIDEVQFFKHNITHVVQELMIKEIEVVAAGLLRDSNHELFGSMPELKKMASTTLEIYGTCMVCGKDATHTYRKSAVKSQVMVGGADMYECRCADCYAKG
jgi:thymidine kinase